MYLTNFSEDKILRAFLGSSVTAPATIYAACFLSNPGEEGLGAEITYPGYARQPIAFSAPATVAGGTSMANIADVPFPAASLAAGTITHCALMDSVVGGNMWAYMTLDEPIVVSAGVAPLIQAQEWNYVSSGNFSNSFKAKYLNLLRGINLPGFSPYISLYNSSPDSGGAELAGDGYSRFPITFGAPEVQASGQSMIKNAVMASSPRSLESWGTWTHTAIFDAASSGEAVAFAELPDHIIMGRGKAAFIQAGDLSVSMN